MTAWMAAAWPWKSRKACCCPPAPVWRNNYMPCAMKAFRCRWTTLVPAIRHCPTCNASASTLSRSTGEFETLEADSLVLALGQDVDLSLLEGVPGLAIKDGTVQVAPNMMTGYPGIFAGGDMVPSERTVTVAVGHGKKAARNIDAWLGGKQYAPPCRARTAACPRRLPAVGC